MLDHQRHGVEVALHAPTIPSDADCILRLNLRKPPKRSRLMRTNGPRQAERRAEMVDRSGFTIVRCDDGSARTLFCGKRLIKTSDLGDYLRPTELVAQPLLQWPIVTNLRLLRPDTQGSLVGQEPRRGQERQHRGNGDREHRECMG